MDVLTGSTENIMSHSQQIMEKLDALMVRAKALGINVDGTIAELAKRPLKLAPGELPTMTPAAEAFPTDAEIRAALNRAIKWAKDNPPDSGFGLDDFINAK